MTKKPNIVFILEDHQAYYRHGWDGGVKPKLPNFDAFKSEGIDFTNAYSATPLCAPVRRSMINGLYPHTHKNYFNDSAIPYDEETYLRLLHQDGYENYYYGKWHAGAGNALTADQHCQGFSSDGYGNPYISDEYKEYCKKRNIEPAKHLIHHNFTSDRLLKDGFFTTMKEGELYECDSSWCGEHASGVTVTSNDSHESFFLANLACDKLEELAKNPNQPFHLRVDFWGPHQPFFPTQEFLDLYNKDEILEYGNFRDPLINKAAVNRRDDNRGISDENFEMFIPSRIPWSTWQEVLVANYAHQSMIDAAAGRVLQKIKDLGLDDNTIIIWTTDHGDGCASHGGHFDKCSYMTQEVMRIPMAIRWPNVLKPVVCDEFVSNLDVPATILDAANLKFSNRVDSRSLLALKDGSLDSWPKDIFCETAGHGYIERINGRMIVEGDYKLVCFEGDLDEMYDLGKDPYELNNLAYEEKYAEKKESLKQLLRRRQKESLDWATFF